MAEIDDVRPAPTVPAGAPQEPQEPSAHSKRTLTFEAFSQAVWAAHGRWPEPVPWNGSDWSNNLAGEVGEVCNVVKKLRRIETGKASPSRQHSEDELKMKLAEEIGDALISLQILARFYDLNLAACGIVKFNATCEEMGFPERL